MSSRNTNIATVQERELMKGVYLSEVFPYISDTTEKRIFSTVSEWKPAEIRSEPIDKDLRDRLHSIRKLILSTVSERKPAEIRSEPIDKDLKDRLLINSITFEAIEGSFKSRGYGVCAERINVLRSTDDLEDGERPLSLESAKTFFYFINDEDFISNFGHFGEPLLGLFSEGTLSAEWRFGNNRLLIEFHPNNAVSFAMMEGIKRLNGRAGRKEIIDTLKRQGIAEWQKD